MIDPEENTEEIEAVIEYADINDTLHNLAQSNEYDSFVQSMKRVIEEQPDIPIAHLLVVAIMDMFGPSFVVLGSPESAPYEDSGLEVPLNIRIAINPSTSMSAQDVIYSLQLITTSMESDLETSDDNLAKEFPND